MGKCHMVLVVPVDEKQSDTGQTRQLVWDAAIHTLQPGLGKLYEAFYRRQNRGGLPSGSPLVLCWGVKSLRCFIQHIWQGTRHSRKPSAITWKNCSKPLSLSRYQHWVIP